jgi:hypothetical protein
MAMRDGCFLRRQAPNRAACAEGGREADTAGLGRVRSGGVVDGAVARRRLSSCKFIHSGQESKDLPLLPLAVAPPLLADTGRKALRPVSQIFGRYGDLILRPATWLA